ncbi:MAG: metal-dependent phosphohydrolase [Christensenellaceae bacterium]|jgi:metal-dependent HD superfamily phosphatase/phosphodiesterase
MAKFTLEEIQANEKITVMVQHTQDYLDTLGYTDHGPRHAAYVSKTTGKILHSLGFPRDRVELGKIAGWIHDVGNFINRKYHSLTGAVLMFDELQQIGMDFEDVCVVCQAIGSHDEEIGKPVSDISAALIIADKVDAYKKRVRSRAAKPDIHMRVNKSIYWTDVDINKEESLITFDLKMKEYSSPMEFMQIYAGRMELCQESAQYLGCTFKLIINDLVMNLIETDAGSKH